MKFTKKLFVFTLLFFTVLVKAQLANFNLEVTKTDETCLGNGSLSFSVSNITPNASLLYKVYLLPDVTTPIAIQTEGYLGSLTAGTYKVTAIQALGELSNTQEQNVTINSIIVAFNFNVASLNTNCSDAGSITVTATSGIASSYEIISGPVTRPLQSSNVFEDLPAGTYNIRAFNNCGNGKVKTHTLSIVTSELTISPPVYPDAISPLCDSITVNNIITPSSGTIAYPVTVEHTLELLDINGNPITMNQTYATGSPESLTVSAVMPRLQADSYNYAVRVVDNCSTVYLREENNVDPSVIVSLSAGSALCAEKYLILSASKFTPPYTLNFLSAPEDFDPAAFNELPAGPFSESTVTYGSDENTIPFGNYVVELTDVCGRTATTELNVEFIKPVPAVTATNNGCFSEFGRIRISINESMLLTAVITAAPTTYTDPLPKTVTGNINSNGMLALNNMPIGIYVIQFTDDCGFEHEVEVEVPPFVEKNFNIYTLPGCEPGVGTVRARSGNGILTAIYITTAPASFGLPLPYDLSANIAGNGQMYKDNLPAGEYVFTATDICGIVKELTVTVQGYIQPQDSYIFTPNCASFSVKVTDSGNGTEGAGYWLQKFNPVTGTWGHPGSGTVYTEGTVPTNSTGVKLNNNSQKNNLNYTGKFRIIKKFETFGNGTNDNNICIKILGEFTYTDGLTITNAYSLACLGQPNDVYLEVSGHPVSYRIIKKNGETFVVDNGLDNVFTNLEPAEYVFRIEDICGNIVTKGFNVQSLPSIADAAQPDDMIVCTEPGTSQTYEFHLAGQDAAVLGPLHSSMYTITYHLTQDDADNDVNPLPEYYTSTGNGQVIYVRLEHNEIALCHGTTSFRLFIGEYQEPKITTTGTLCKDGKLALAAGQGYSSYLWSTGETSRIIFVTEPGIYTVVVEKAYGNRSCDGFAEVEVTESSAPEIIKVETRDWTDDQNMITVLVDGIGEYEYSIDGEIYQESNVFTGLENGLYTVYVKDAHGCGTDTKEVVLLNYPKFFTPNGDGSNDKWRIKYSVKEPHMKVTIFDRYGKLITTFGSNHEGWDGTLNGIQLPSTDYWFVVTREDGRELKGHFAMIR